MERSSREILLTLPINIQERFGLSRIFGASLAEVRLILGGSMPASSTIRYTHTLSRASYASPNGNLH